MWNALCCPISLRKLLLLVVLLFALLGLLRLLCNLLSGHLCQTLALKEKYLCQTRFCIRKQIFGAKHLTFRNTFQAILKVIPIPKSCLTIRYAINYVATILIKWSPLLTRIPNLIFFLHACIFPRKSKSRFSLSVKYKPHDSGCCFYFNSLFCWIDKIELLLNKKVITCVDLKHVMHIHCKKMG